MKKLLLSLLLFPALLIGQATTGFHRSSQALARATGSQYVVVQPNAVVYVTSTATGTVATIYSDPLLSISIPSGSVVADQNGNYGYYININYCVNEQISYPGGGSQTTTNICGNTGTISTPVSIANGGTASSTAAGAAANIVNGNPIAPSGVIDSALTPGTSAICPHGTSGAFTTTGCLVVTSFAAPSGSWPMWLVPTVTGTLTPSLAVAASAIPNSALSSPTITINSTPCTLGSSCSLSSTAYINQLTGDGTAGPGSGSQVFTAVKIPPSVTLTGTPSAGYVPTATSSVAATWQAAQSPINPNTPSVTLGSPSIIGSGASFTKTGNDYSGQIVLTTGSGGSGTGTLFTLAFGGSYSATVYCGLFPSPSNLASGYISGAASTSGFTATGQVSASSVVYFTYHCHP